MMIFHRLAAALLILIATTAACATPETVPSPLPPLGAVTQPKKLADMSTPLEAYYGTPAERHLLARAEDVFIRDCVRRLGLDWPVEQPREIRMSIQAWDLGYLDAPTVAAHGYHQPGLDADFATSSGGPATGPRVLSGALKAAYVGLDHPELAGKPVPKQGCGPEAQRLLNAGAPQVNGQQSLEYANATGETALADPRVAAITGEWSKCMAGKGFAYKDPYAARDDPAWTTIQTPGEVERTTAVADLGCRVETNYAGVRLAVLAAHQKREIASHQWFFASARAQHLQRVRNATTALSSTHHGEVDAIPAAKLGA